LTVSAWGARNEESVSLNGIVGLNDCYRDGGSGAPLPPPATAIVRGAVRGGSRDQGAVLVTASQSISLGGVPLRSAVEKSVGKPVLLPTASNRPSAEIATHLGT
jgi:hypothetical protein